MTEIERNATLILRSLAVKPRDTALKGPEVAAATGLEPGDINDAVRLLDEAGLVEWLQTLGTAPYDFNQVEITSRGRYELQRLDGPEQDSPASATTMRPPLPVGSPYGFTDEDWEMAALRKADASVLNVVLGMKFESQYFDPSALRANVEAMFERAVQAYNATPGALPVSLAFRPLGAGYGEHLFNQIARDIISADIAVFETSDLSANVMLEMGVALTWDVRVLPIKAEGRGKPPSDVSGQTWADYRDSAAVFVSTDHADRLVAMVDRAVRKKSHAVSAT